MLMLVHTILYEHIRKGVLLTPCNGLKLYSYPEIKTTRISLMVKAKWSDVHSHITRFARFARFAYFT